MSLFVNQTVTPHTSKHNKFYLDTFQGKRALFLERYDYREFVNPAQLDHVINDIVVNKGFLMDKQQSDMIRFSHSHNTPEHQTFYIVWTKTTEVEKVTREFVYFV